jgi:hypothetical protein
MTDAGCGLPQFMIKPKPVRAGVLSGNATVAQSSQQECFQRLGDYDRGFLGRISVNEASSEFSRDVGPPCLPPMAAAAPPLPPPPNDTLIVPALGGFGLVEV